MTAAPILQRALLAAIACLAVVCSPGCSRDASQPAEPTAGPRIVSLTPGITRMLVDMGLGDRIVGVAQHDDAVPPGADPPVMGNYLDVDLEKLSVAQPTHVLMMSGKEGEPANLRAMADRFGFRLVVYNYPRSIADVAAMLHDPTGRLTAPSLGEALDREARASELRETMMKGLTRLAELTEGMARPRTLLVIGEGVPVMALGPGGPMHELLHIAGGANAAAASGVPAPTYDREKLAALDPEAIVLLSPGAPPLGDADRDARLSPFRGLPIPAIDRGRVYLLNDPLVLLPSTSMLDIAAELTRTLHPDLAPAVERTLEKVRSGS